MASALRFLAAVTLSFLAPASIVTGLVGIYRWARTDQRVPRARVRGRWPRRRPGLAAPLLRVVVGGLVLAWLGHAFVGWMIAAIAHAC